MALQARTSSYKTLADSELISDPARVVPLLDRLAKRHVPLTVRISGYDEYFTSYIVGVDQRQLLLDELLPSAGQPQLEAKRELQASAKLDGIDIRFVTSLTGVDREQKMLTNTMKLPQQLEYRQRRMSYRVPIPMSRKMRVIIDSHDGRCFEGVLHDLSHGGAGMVFADGEPVVEPGLLHDCAIELLDDEWLYCTVELRYSKNIPSRGRQLIGARFPDLSRAQAGLLGHCINELEREFIRRRTAD